MSKPARQDDAQVHPDLFGHNESACQRPPHDEMDEAAAGCARVLQPDRRQVELRAVDLESLLQADHQARLVWGYVERQDRQALYGAIKARGSAPGRKAIIGVVSLVRVAQDGVRVRANAGAASFKRRERLGKQLKLAREHVQKLKERAKTDPGEPSRREQAARERAAREREKRIELALAQLPEIEAAKRHNAGKADEARANTTDAQARVMKMADGGLRPAYNVQFATDCASQVVVGVDVTTAGSNMAQLAPMVEQVEQRLGRVAEQWLVDGGFPAHEQIDAVAHKTEVLAPVPKPRKAKGQDDDRDPPAPGSEFEPKADDSPAVAQWRARMNTDAARTIYKERAATAECVNAQARNRGLQHLPLRGLLKARCVALLHALAHNLVRTAKLAPQLVGAAPAPLIAI